MAYVGLINAGKQSPPKLTPGLEDVAVGQTAMRIFDIVAFEQDRQLTLRLKRGSNASRMFGDVVVSYAVFAETKAAERCRLLTKDDVSAWSLRKSDATPAALGRLDNDAPATAEFETTRRGNG